MKLFLHWLLWDLRRFRPMLIVWTLLVLGYAVFLGWMHARILTIDAGWLEWSRPLAVGLGVLEFFLLMVLFISDPGVGADAFWKTRPPTGRAVAGAKLVIALGFFLVLPLAAWGVMHWLCVLPGGPRQGWEGMSWTRVLCLIQSMGLLVFLGAGAEVRDARQLLLRIAGVVAVVAVMQLWPMVYLGLPWVEFNGSGHRLIHDGRAMLIVCSLALLLGSGLFLTTGQRRAPSWRPGWVVRLSPVALILGITPFLPDGPGRRERLPAPERPVASTLAAGIRVDQSGQGPILGTWQLESAPRRTWRRFSAQFHLSGLPAGTRARARWLELRLLPNEGPPIPAEIPA